MVTVIFILLSATIAFQSFIIVKGETQDRGFVIKTTVIYSNPSNGTRIWNLTEEDRTINLFMNNAWQTVQLMNHSYGLETTTIDEDGNPITVLCFPKSELQPGENINYTVTYHALSKPRSLPNINEEGSETREDIPNDLKDRYSGAEGPWLVNNSKLQDLARNITKGETKGLTIVKKLITWIRDNVTYKTHETPLYPNQTYTEREGDCDDQAILFITLCRILRIPSYLQIGCIYMPTTPLTQNKYWDGHLTTCLKQIGWHGWAMVYVPPWGWLPVDFTYVIGGLGDPLNAIKRAAVVHFQEVIQYMNVTRTDYVASSRTYGDFLKNNDFYIHTQDEMTQTLPENPLGNIIEKLFPWILVYATVVVAVVIAGIFMYIRKKKKLKETESKLNPNYGPIANP